MSDRTSGIGSDRSAGPGGGPNAHDRPVPTDGPAVVAGPGPAGPIDHGHGRHEMGQRPGDPESTRVFTPDGKPADQGFTPGTPPWQRGNQPPSEEPRLEPAATTEVYRPAAGVATAVASHTTVAEPVPKPPGLAGHTSGPRPFTPPPVPPGHGAPGHLPPGPGNGQLPNPFGGSGPDPARRHEPGRHEPMRHEPVRPPIGRPTARPTPPVRGRIPRPPRKASLQIRRFDPWSVLKLSLVLSVAMFLMWLVAVGVLYGVLNGMGVWDKLNGTWNDLASVNEADGGSDPLISAGRVFGISAVVGAINIVLFTAFATVLAFIYNVSADLAGGIEVTLSERD